MTNAPPAATRAPHAPPGQRRPSRIAALVDRGVSLDRLVTAAVAVGCLVVVRFAVALVQLLGNAVDYDPSFYSGGFLRSPVGLFLGSVVLYPLPFYAAALVALTVVLPILRESSLPTVLGRSLLTGAAATVVLALSGVVTGIVQSGESGAGIVILIWAVFIPLSAGVQLTAVLAAGAVVAWLWAEQLHSTSVREAEAQDPATTVAADTPADDAVGPDPAPTPREAPATRPDPPLSIYAPPDDRE